MDSCYLLFAWEEHDALGGWHDLIGRFPTLEKATQQLPTLRERYFDEWHIIDGVLGIAVLSSGDLNRAAEVCEWCEMVLQGSDQVDPARCPDGLTWVHYDGNGEQMICYAGDIWEEAVNG